MCRIIKVQDANSYRPVTRPLRLHGHSTSVRLEAAYWQILEEIARKERMSLGRLAGILHDEMCEQDGDVTNFASCLRVTCLHYVANRDGGAAKHSEVPPPRIVHLDFPPRQNSPSDIAAARYYPRPMGLD